MSASRHRPRRGRAFAVLILVAGCTTGPSPSATAPDPGQVGVRQWADNYVEALNSRDVSAIAHLVNREASSDDVRRRVERYGGLSLRATAVEISNDFPRIYVVNITVVDGNGNVRTLHQVLEWNGHRWDVGAEAVELPT